MTTAVPAETTTNSVADFDLGHLEIENATAKLHLPMVTPEAFIIVKPAREENRQFKAGSLRMSGKRDRNLLQKGVITDTDVDDDRKEDRVLYPKYVVVGWGGIFNKHGELVQFNHENCKAFITKLPVWIFDRIRIFCMKPESFLSDQDLAEQQEPDPVEVAGN